MAEAGSPPCSELPQRPGEKVPKEEWSPKMVAAQLSELLPSRARMSPMITTTEDNEEQGFRESGFHVILPLHSRVQESLYSCVKTSSVSSSSSKQQNF